MKKMLSVALAAALVLGMAGCGGAGTPETTATEATTTATEAAKESETSAAGSTEAQKAPEQSEGGKKAAMITAQPLGDKGVTDNTYEGFKRGCEEFGYEPTVVEVQAGEYEETLRALCQEGYDIIMPCWSALEDACAKVSAEYPDSEFIMVFSEIELPNVKSLISKQEDGSYLAGVAAAMTTKNDHIAFMGGSDNPQINKFLAGYDAGAKAVNPDIKIDVTWVGSFDDPAKGKELALMLYNQGADIIYVAAAASSTGVFDAAKETGGMVVGCDVDQNGIVPGQVIGSMVINYGNWVYQAFQEREDGGLKFGAYKYGLENDGLDLLLPEESVYKTPDDIAAAVAEAKEKILSGEIVAPTAVQ